MKYYCNPSINAPEVDGYKLTAWYFAREYFAIRLGKKNLSKTRSSALAKKKKKFGLDRYRTRAVELKRKILTTLLKLIQDCK